jgi:hypothetical protein
MTIISPAAILRGIQNLQNSFFNSAGKLLKMSGDLDPTGKIGSIFGIGPSEEAVLLDVNVPYVQLFDATTDWGAPSAGLYTITVLATTHGLGVNVNAIEIYETIGSTSVFTLVNDVIIDNSTGDVSITVTETPDGRFAGKIVIIQGQCIANNGGNGITSLNSLTNSTQNFSTASAGTDFTINSAGNTHTFNLPDAALGVRGVLRTGYQNIDGAKTFQTDTSGGAKGAGLYNADVTDNNQLTINWECDTTGAGSQTQFATTFLGATTKVHNHSTLTTTVSWNTYINGTQKTVWSLDENLNIFTDGAITSNGTLNVNNGFIRGGAPLDVLTGQGFNQGANSMGGGITVPVTGPITGTNIFGTNLAQQVLWNEDMDGGLLPFLGVSVVGYVGQVAGLVSGKTMETINMAVAGASDGGSVAGAVLNNFNMYNGAGMLGAPAMTINNMRMFYTPAGLGGAATNEWGICIDASMDNYLDKSLTIGGGAGSKTTNPDIALEIKSLKTFKLPSFTTIQKNAIASPEAGMKLFDTDLAKECVYSGIAWETITSI